MHVPHNKGGDGIKLFVTWAVEMSGFVVRVQFSDCGLGDEGCTCVYELEILVYSVGIGKCMCTESILADVGYIQRQI